MVRRSRGSVIVGVAILGSLGWAACGGDEAAGPADAAVGSDGSATDDGTTADSALPRDGAARDSGAADAAADGATDAGAPSFCVRAAGASGSDTACLARLPVGAKNLRYYRSHSLDQTNGAIQNLVFIQHSNNRNAWDYYDLLAAAAIARDPL
ncbi:MAG TPA: hypothetical protein VLT33_19430, partial [Labilithrix sp.]|nr:hypothetical protein [Labilithrix sp.]